LPNDTDKLKNIPGPSFLAERAESGINTCWLICQA
jgi:hypothetical protein